MGTRPVFVFANFTIVVVQNLLLFILISNVSSTVLLPHLSFLFSRRQSQHQPAGRTLSTSRLTRATRTAAGTLLASSTADKKHYLSSLTPAPGPSSPVRFKRRKRSEETGPRANSKPHGDKDNEGVAAPYLSSSPRRSVVTQTKHMTVILDDTTAATTPVPSTPLFQIPDLVIQKKYPESPSSSSSLSSSSSPSSLLLLLSTTPLSSAASPTLQSSSSSSPSPPSSSIPPILPPSSSLPQPRKATTITTLHSPSSSSSSSLEHSGPPNARGFSQFQTTKVLITTPPPTTTLSKASLNPASFPSTFQVNFFKSSLFTPTNGASFSFVDQNKNRRPSQINKTVDKTRRGFFSTKEKQKKQVKIKTRFAAIKYFSRSLQTSLIAFNNRRKTNATGFHLKIKTKKEKQKLNKAPNLYRKLNVNEHLLKNNYGNWFLLNKRNKTLPNQENQRPMNDQFLKNKAIRNFEVKTRFLKKLFNFRNETQSKISDDKVNFPRSSIKDISEIKIPSTSDRVFTSTTMPTLHEEKPNHVNKTVSSDVKQGKHNHSVFLKNLNQHLQPTDERTSEKNESKTFQNLFFKNQTLQNSLRKNAHVQTAILNPVMKEGKKREFFIPDTKLSSSSVLLETLLVSVKTPGFEHGSLLGRETGVDRVSYKPKEKLHPDDLNPTISSSRKTENQIIKSEKLPDIETIIFDTNSDNSKLKEEFILYQIPEKRLSRVKNHPALESPTQTDTFITARVSSSTLPASNPATTDVLTTVNPLTLINKSLLKPALNFSLSLKRSEKHKDTFKRFRRNIDHKININSKNPKVSGSFINEKSHKNKESQNLFKNDQIYRRKKAFGVSRRVKRDAQTPVGLIHLKSVRDKIRQRKRRSLLTDYAKYINLENRIEARAKMAHKKRRLSSKNKIFPDRSINKDFVVRTQPKSHGIRNYKMADYEPNDLSPAEPFSVYEFVPAESAPLPPVLILPENSEPIQILKITAENSKESSIESNSADFGSGDELASSFLVPCSNGEKYYCLNAGTCLIVYTMDVKTCRCPVGFSGQRCEQIDHNYFYSVL